MQTALFVGVVSVVIIVAWIVVVLLCFLPTHQYLRSNPILLQCASLVCQNYQLSNKILSILDMIMYLIDQSLMTEVSK